MTGSAMSLLVAFAKEECVGCHGPAKQSGGFRFDVWSSLMKKRGRLQPAAATTA